MPIPSIGGADRLKQQLRKAMLHLPHDVRVTIYATASTVTLANRRAMASDKPEDCLSPFVALAICCELFAAFEECQLRKPVDNSNSEHG